MGLEQIVPNLTKTHSDPFLLDYSRLFIGPFFHGIPGKSTTFMDKKTAVSGEVKLWLPPLDKTGEKESLWHKC